MNGPVRLTPLFVGVLRSTADHTCPAAPPSTTMWMNVALPALAHPADICQEMESEVLIDVVATPLTKGVAMPNVGFAALAAGAATIPATIVASTARMATTTDRRLECDRVSD